MKTTALILLSALIWLPMRSHAQAPKPDHGPEPQFALQCVVAVVVVAVVGTGIYVIHKCNEASKDKCTICDEEVPKDAEFCPNCGNPFRCSVCDTEFPEDANVCPNCGTDVPDPVPPKNAVQMSTDGAHWTTVVPAGPQKFSGVQVRHFDNQNEFDTWVNSRRTPVTVHRLEMEAPQQAFFRLASE